MSDERVGMNKDIAPKREITPEVRRRIIQWLSKAVMGIIVYSLILFLSAGRLNWLWGWVLLALLTIHLAAQPLLLLPSNPELLAEREKGFLYKEVKGWDKWLTTLAGGMMLLSWLVAGLDFRFQWTGPIPLIYHLGGFLITSLGYTLFMWAMLANAFFSEGVRIQPERGHIVATGGPYGYVRHPGYVGVILTHLATPFLLGSLWALLPALGLVVVFVGRTWLEDQTLLAELPGYKDYARQTRYRLLPGMW